MIYAIFVGPRVRAMAMEVTSVVTKPIRFSRPYHAVFRAIVLLFTRFPGELVRPGPESWDYGPGRKIEANDQLSCASAFSASFAVWLFGASVTAFLRCVVASAVLESLL